MSEVSGGRSAAGNENADVRHHLMMLRQTINIYEYMSLATKVMALMVGASAFILMAFGHPTDGVIALSLITAVIMVFVLWWCDGHFRTTKWAFIRLFDAVRNRKVAIFDMNPAPFKGDKGLVVRAMWAAPHPWIYVTLVIVIAALNFMR